MGCALRSARTDARLRAAAYAPVRTGAVTPRLGFPPYTRRERSRVLACSYRACRETESRMGLAPTVCAKPRLEALPCASSVQIGRSACNGPCLMCLFARRISAGGRTVLGAVGLRSGGGTALGDVGPRSGLACYGGVRAKPQARFPSGVSMVWQSHVLSSCPH